MKLIIIAGGGKFGNIALDYAIDKGYSVIVVDKDQHCILAKRLKHKFSRLEGVFSFFQNIDHNAACLLIHNVSVIPYLLEKKEIEFIIPVVPVHLLESLILFSLGKLEGHRIRPDVESLKKTLARIDSELLLFQDEKKAIAYLSHAKFNETCPENCSGPLNFCPNFQREKPLTITQALKQALDTPELIFYERERPSRLIFIAESMQLTAGLGGIKGSTIQLINTHLNEASNALMDQDVQIVIATTCNCHGVVNFYKNY